MAGAVVALSPSGASDASAAREGFRKREKFGWPLVIFSVECVRGVCKALELWEEIKTPPRATTPRNI